VRLGSPDELPTDKRLVFFLKSKTPVSFPRSEKVEVSAVDGSFHTFLSLADGSLVLEDAKTALGVVEPLVKFGSSAFGPVHVRVMSADGTAGDWLPLGTLVRLPGFKELRCPRSTAKPCTLIGSNLFLAASIAATPEFNNATNVPPDFTGTQLSVPHAADGVLYLKLRDDTDTVQTLTLPVTETAKSQSAAAPPAATPATVPPAAAPATPDSVTPPAVAPPAAAPTTPETPQAAAPATKTEP
jgi:hypothetical protein